MYSATDSKIQENAKIDLPCWLAEVLYAPPGYLPPLVIDADFSEYVEFEIPIPFRRVVLNALTASPTSVDLRSQSGQFYAFAEKIMNLYQAMKGNAINVDYGIHLTRNHKLNSRHCLEYSRMLGPFF